MQFSWLRYRLLFIISVVSLFFVPILSAQSPQDDRNFSQPSPDRPEGLTVYEVDQVLDGYILAQLIQSKEVLLISRDGRIVHKWEGENYLGTAAYLTEDGLLIRSSSVPDTYFNRTGQFGFTGGRIEAVNWDNEVVWSFDYYGENFITHHDMEILPNGNVLLIAFDKHPRDEAIALGFDPEKLDNDPLEVWSEHIIEVNPQTQEIVWEWYVWDHLVQDYDETLPNYGVISENPHRINVNYLHQGTEPNADWLHFNGIDYNPIRDEIVLSSRTYNEIWIIDHSTSTEEAAGSAGDLLYRWGNPAVHGVDAERQLYFQHNPEWISENYPGAGNMTIFDNGGDDRLFSRSIEIALPLDENGNYIMAPNQATGVDSIVWEYIGDEEHPFFAIAISNTTRLANGNTLINEGMYGRVFEVTPDGDIVWEYYLPPATLMFKANFYDYPVLAERDAGQSLAFEGGDVWQVTCESGEINYLYAYNFGDSSIYREYVNDFGEAAESVWASETCE